MLRRGILKENARSIDICKRIIDLFCVFFASYFAFLLKFGIDSSIFDRYLLLILVGVVISFFYFYIFPIYKSWRGISILTEIKILISAWLCVFVTIIALTFFKKISAHFSREWVFTWFFIGLVLLVTNRIIIKKVVVYLRKRGYNQRNVCLLSYGKYGKEVFSEIMERPEFGFDIEAVYADNIKSENSMLFSNKLKGRIKDFFNLENVNKFDQIWISAPLEKFKLLSLIVEKLKYETCDIRYIPNFQNFNLINHAFSEIAGIPFFEISSSPMQDGSNKALKRFEDIIISLLILIFISPIMAIIGILVKKSSPGPVFYKQVRVGLNNKPFQILKFRSMPVDVEKNTGATWAKEGEQRATKIGSFLRKTSLDELPQFINVIKGEMSIVGPRPERPEFVDKFKEEIPFYMKKHMVKAGITGWAQVNGWRGNTDLKKRIEHDIYYIENWSLIFDLKVIIMTIIKVLFDKNAY